MTLFLNWIRFDCTVAPVQEQQKESAKLRARIGKATVERATLLADVKACGLSIDARKVCIQLSLHLSTGERRVRLIKDILASMAFDSVGIAWQQNTPA